MAVGVRGGLGCEMAVSRCSTDYGRLDQIDHVIPSCVEGQTSDLLRAESRSLRRMCSQTLGVRHQKQS